MSRLRYKIIRYELGYLRIQFSFDIVYLKSISKAKPKLYLAGETICFPVKGDNRKEAGQNFKKNFKSPNQ